MKPEAGSRSDRAARADARSLQYVTIEHPILVDATSGALVDDRRRNVFERDLVVLELADEQGRMLHMEQTLAAQGIVVSLVDDVRPFSQSRQKISTHEVSLYIT